MAIADEILSNPNLSRTSYDVSQQLGSGIQTGIALARAQQDIEGQKAELEFRREKLKEDSFNRAMDNIVKSANVKNPAARKFLLSNSTELLQRAGYQVDPNALGELASNPDYTPYLSQFLNAPEQIRKNPVLAQNLAGMLRDIESTSPQFQAFKSALDGLYRSEASAAGVEGKLAQTDTQIASKAVEQGIPPAVMLDLLGRNGPEAQARAQQNPQVQASLQAAIAAKQAKATGTQAQLATAGANVQRAADNTRNIDSLIEYRKGLLANGAKRLDVMKDTMGLRLQQLGLAKERLNIRQEQFKNTLAQQVVANPQLTKVEAQINNADKGLVTLNNPNLKWTDLNEVATDTAALLSGAGGQVTVSGEQRVTFNSLKKTLDTWRGKIENREAGGPSAEEIQIFRDRLSRIRNEVAHFHDTQLNKLVAGKYGNLGAQYQPIIKAAFDSAKLDPNAEINLQPAEKRAVRDTNISKGLTPEGAKPGVEAKAAPSDLLPLLRAKGGTDAQIKEFYIQKGFALPKELK